MADGVSKCGRKSALSIFFASSVIGFVFCLLSLLSPSWQYVYLENGRTEHHHGLWLDCKRDYSFDYGRPREYYETLWRRDLEGSPFAVFFLPPLNCVYKFDFYIDPEDLYDHDHDENRIQNDAYQHLFLGWKIAALAGVGVSVCFCMAALLLGICSFCHRTFICACTVLISISAFLSTIGWLVFFIWANYQDNKVIKEEEDTTYEQKLGYAFYFQIIGSIILWVTSVLGCCVTSISLGKSRGAKLVKIEVIEGDDSVPLNSTHSTQPFKRSVSAIYRVDSSALRQWEKDYLKRSREHAMAAESNFKRTASMPNFSKKQQKQERRRARQLARTSQDFFSSASNITEMTQASSLTLNTHNTVATAPAPLLPLDPSTPKLKSALKTPKSSRKDLTLNDTDPTYDYLACPSSAGVSSFLGSSPAKKHVYDPVYEQIGPGISQEYYLEPNSVKEGRSTSTLNKDSSKKALLPSLSINGSSQSIPVVQQKTTIIDDVVRPLSWQTEKKNAEPHVDARRIHEKRTIEEMTRSERFQKVSRPSEPPPKPALDIREFGIDLNKRNLGTAEITKEPERSPKKYANLLNTGHPESERAPPSPLQYTQIAKDVEVIHRTETSVDDLPDPPPRIALNTFGMGGRASQRSITNLAFYPGSSSVPEVFERPESSIPPTKTTEKKNTLDLRRQLFSTLPDEVDRSVGSSTQLENETMSETGSYIKDANVRLNLFLNDVKKSSQDETTV